MTIRPGETAVDFAQVRCAQCACACACACARVSVYCLPPPPSPRPAPPAPRRYCSASRSPSLPRAGLKPVPWDGYMKYVRGGPRSARPRVCLHPPPPPLRLPPPQRWKPSARFIERRQRQVCEQLMAALGLEEDAEGGGLRDVPRRILAVDRSEHTPAAPTPAPAPAPAPTLSDLPPLAVAGAPGTPGSAGSGSQSVPPPPAAPDPAAAARRCCGGPQGGRVVAHSGSSFEIGEEEEGAPAALLQHAGSPLLQHAGLAPALRTGSGPCRPLCLPGLAAAAAPGGRRRRPASQGHSRRRGGLGRSASD